VTTQTLNHNIEQLYSFITGEDDEGHICDAIPDDACSYVPQNFFLNVLNGSATKLGDQLGSPNLVLPWFLDVLGAPAFLAGWLVPIRRSFALLPQLAIAGWMRQFKKRKWFWAAGGAGFGLAFTLMIVAASVFSPANAGLLVVLLLAVASLARGVSSVAFKDVLAKTIPQGRRGTLLATRATVGGMLTLIAGLLLRLFVASETDIQPFLILLGATAVLWFIGAGIAAMISEEDGATSGARNAFKEARAGWRVLRQAPGFRKFIITRALLLSVKLAVPYYALYARRLIDGHIGDLSLFVIATGLSEVLSSPFWGRYSDRSSRTVMMWGGLLAVVVGILALAIGLLPTAWQTPFALAPVFLLIGFAQAGVRLGRKTYLVDAAPKTERPLYVALSNTLIGLVTLTSGVLGLLAQLLGIRFLLFLLVLVTACGVFVCWRMPEADQMVAT
jgi:MFS family permease